MHNYFATNNAADVHFLQYTMFLVIFNNLNKKFFDWVNKILVAVNNYIMIKSNKKIKLIHNFEMEYSHQIVLPSIIKDKDISAMFCGLVAIVKQQAEFKSKQLNQQKDSAYNVLLKMYLNTLKKMNFYKSLYLKEKSKVV